MASAHLEAKKGADMITGPIIAPLANAVSHAAGAGARFFGYAGVFGSAGRSHDQKVTYRELVNLTDRQLDDIGLPRGLIDAVVLQGSDALRDIRTGDGASRRRIRPANASRSVPTI